MKTRAVAKRMFFNDLGGYPVDEPGMHTPAGKSPFQRYKKGSNQERDGPTPSVRTPTVRRTPRGGSSPPDDDHSSHSSNESDEGKYHRVKS